MEPYAADGGEEVWPHSSLAYCDRLVPCGRFHLPSPLNLILALPDGAHQPSPIRLNHRAPHVHPREPAIQSVVPSIVNGRANRHSTLPAPLLPTTSSPTVSRHFIRTRYNADFTFMRLCAPEVCVSAAKHLAPHCPRKLMT
jgi:hypothetical protein